MAQGVVSGLTMSGIKLLNLWNMGVGFSLTEAKEMKLETAYYVFGLAVHDIFCRKHRP